MFQCNASDINIVREERVFEHSSMENLEIKGMGITATSCSSEGTLCSLRRAMSYFYIGTYWKNGMKSMILRVSLFSLMLIISIAGSICVVKADATDEPKVSYDTWGHVPGYHRQENLTLIILSPLSNEVLNDNAVTVRVNVSTQAWAIDSVYYQADWQEGVHCIYDVSNQTFNWNMLYKLSITANFTDIPDGRHHLTFYAHIHDGSQGSSSVDFTINAPPQIAILSPRNETYEVEDLPLNFTVSEPVKWVGYSLDGKENVTVDGNSTINSLTNGFHSITVYANDTSGNMGASQTVDFSVNKPTSRPPLNSAQTVMIFVGVVIAVVVAVGVGLQIYRKKHKRI